MSQCVWGTWSDYTWKKQIRGCVYNPIAVFPAWNSLSWLLSTYSLKCLRWENRVYILGQALSIDLRRLELALIPVDTFILSLGSRSSVVCGEGSVDHGQIPWLFPEPSLSICQMELLLPFLTASSCTREAHVRLCPNTPEVCDPTALYHYKASSLFCCAFLTSDLPICHYLNYFKSYLSRAPGWLSP